MEGRVKGEVWRGGGVEGRCGGEEVWRGGVEGRESEMLSQR